MFLPSANHILCGVRLSSGVCDAAVTSAATRVVLGVELLLMLRWYDTPPVCRPAFEGSRTPEGSFSSREVATIDSPDTPAIDAS